MSEILYHLTIGIYIKIYNLNINKNILINTYNKLNLL